MSFGSSIGPGRSLVVAPPLVVCLSVCAGVCSSSGCLGGFVVPLVGISELFGIYVLWVVTLAQPLSGGGPPVRRLHLCLWWCLFYFSVFFLRVDLVTLWSRWVASRWAL